MTAPATPDGNGYGTIYLNIATGSVENDNFLVSYGILKIGHGTLAISARDTIGLVGVGGAIQVFAGALAAETTGLLNPNGNNGIYIYSATNLNIEGYNTINGLTTANGNIDVELAAGKTLSYYQLNAGSGGNIQVVADIINLVQNFTVQRELPSLVPITSFVTVLKLVPFTFVTDLSFLFFSFIESYTIYLLIPVAEPVITFVEENTLQNVSLGANSAQISGTGDLTFLNATDRAPIQVGGTTAATGTLLLSDAVLATVQSGFASLIIGRSKPASGGLSTGDVTIETETFDQALTTTINGSAIDLVGSVTASGALQLISYITDATNAGLNGHIVFSNSKTYTAPTIFVNAACRPRPWFCRAPLSRLLPVGTVGFQDGLIQVIGAGAVNVNGTLTANNPTSNIEITAATDINFNSNAVTATGLIELVASTGAINNNTSGRIKAANLSLDASKSISLNVNIDTLVLAETFSTGANITLNNDDGSNGALTINQMSTLGGNISLTTTGDIDLSRFQGNTSPIIQTPVNGYGAANPFTVTLTGQGVFQGDSVFGSDIDIKTDKLVLTALSDISDGTGVSGTNSLLTQVSDLSAVTGTALSAITGSINIINTGQVILRDIETHNGAIQVQTDSTTTILDVTTNNTGTHASTFNSILIENNLIEQNGNIDIGIAATTTPVAAAQMGTINAGAQGDVTLISDGLILGVTGFNLITGDVVSLTAFGAASSITNPAISVALRATSVDATTTGLGQIILSTDRDLILDDIQSFSGDIHVTTTGVAAVNLQTSDINANAASIFLTASGTITEFKPGTPNPSLIYKIQGVTLTAQSSGDTFLDTSVQNLDANVSVSGSLTVANTDSLNVYQATTDSGDIAITAGQINLVTGQILSAGNIFVGLLTAGVLKSGESNVTLTAMDAFIQDLTAATDPSFVSPGPTYAPLLSADVFTANADLGIDGLHTAVTTFNATTTIQGAEIIVTEKDDITINSVVMSDGDFTLTAGGQITVNNLSTNTSTGVVNLTSTTSSIVQTTGQLAAFGLDLQAITGINLNNIDISTLLLAETSGTGDITLNNVSSGPLTVNQIQATAGPISLTTNHDLILSRVANFTGAIIQTPLNGYGATTPYLVTLTSGGKIQGDSVLGTDIDILTDKLSMISASDINGGGVNSLLTQVSDLSAVVGNALSAISGSINIINTGLVILRDVETFDGLINIQTDSTTTILNVSTNNTGANASSTHTITIDNNLTAVSGNILIGIAGTTLPLVAGQMGTINAGAIGDVTLVSNGLILGVDGLNLITGDVVTLLAHGNAATVKDPAISVMLRGTSVDATTTGQGQIILTTDQNLILVVFQSFNGDIHVTSQSNTNPAVNLQTIDVNDNEAEFYLTASGTITEFKPGTPNPNLIYKIQGVTLFAQSSGNSFLDTVITNLDAHVSTSGSLTVDQTGDLNVYSAITDNGPITITVIPAGVATGANIFVGTLTAGALVTGESDVNLTANGGYIQDLDITTITDPEIVKPGSYAPLLSGATFTAIADLGIHGLHTAVTTFDATTTATTAFILVTEKDDILIDHVSMPFGEFTLTAGGTIEVNDLTANMSSSTVNLTSQGSRIEMETSQITAKITANILNATAVTGIQAWTNINDLTALITDTTTAISGIPDDINVRNDGNLTLEQAYTPLGTFTLNLVDGALTPSLATNPLAATPVYHVVANDIVINTTTGIGTSPIPTGYLSVYADQVDATASVSGGIYIHNYKLHSSPSAFTLDQVLANNGPISIISAGDTYARDVEIHKDAFGNDITLTTTDAGNLLLNFVGTGLSDAIIGQIPPQNGIATFISAGNIEAVDAGIMLQDVNIVAKDVVFRAQTGIGSGDVGILMTATSLSAQTVTGNIILGNSSTTDFFITDFTTLAGNLAFTQKGGGALYATDLVTYDGNIKLTVGNGAYLFLGNTFGVGNTTLIADHINFQGGPGSIFGTGILNIHPDNPLQFVELNSFFASTIFENSDTLEISKVGFEAFFTNFTTILIGNQSSPALTYMYYDVNPGDGPYLGELSTGYDSGEPDPDAGL